MEHRIASELRTVGRTLTGLAVPFNVPANINGRFLETVLPNAFAASIATDDVRHSSITGTIVCLAGSDRKPCN